MVIAQKGLSVQCVWGIMWTVERGCTEDSQWQKKGHFNWLGWTATEQNITEKLEGYNVAEVFKMDWTTKVILFFLLPKVEKVYLDDSQLCLIDFLKSSSLAEVFT